MGEPRVAVGRIVKPHGIRGEVVVAPLTDRDDRFIPGAVLHVGRVDLAIASSRPHQGRVLVRFEGVEDRSAAERLRGSLLEAVPVEEEPGETYLVSELVGMAVVTDEGRELGTVRSAIELPDAAGYDLLEVERPDGTTWLLPAVEDYVAVDEDDAGRELLVVFDPPEGLIGEV